MSDRLTPETEAREAINSIRMTLSKNGEAVGNGEHDFSIIEMIENLIQSRDYFIRKSDSLERERDEAREQAQRLRVQLNHYTQANEMAEQAFSERNKVHKIAEQAIDDLAWFNETNAQRLRTELEQLERERDEELMDRANGDIATMTINHYERILRERDDAREEAARWEAIAVRESKERSEWALRAEKERDEAIESRKRWEKAAFDLFDLCEERRGK